MRLTRTDAKQVEGDSKGSHGLVLLKESRERRDNHDNVSDTTDGDTPANHPETTEFDISHPTEDDTETVGQELEGLSHGGSSDRTLSKGTGSQLRSLWWRTSTVSSGRQTTTDEVLVHLPAAVVGSTLSELDRA